MLLQNLAEVKGASVASCKSMCPGQIVQQDSLGLSALGITFHEHPSQGAFRSYHTIFPCCDGAFSAFQLPLSGRELLSQLDGYHRCHHRARRRRPTLIKKRDQLYDKKWAHVIASAE
jgi:hypothetical protein